MDSERPSQDSSAPVEVGEVTRLLAAHRAGDAKAFEQLIPLVYDDLRRIARARLRGAGPGATLDTVGLVHEVWMRMAPRTRGAWNDRDHFFCVCAAAMRQIIISSARRRLAAKRGGGAAEETFDELRLRSPEEPERVLALDEALARLQQQHPRMASIVECRHFGGMTNQETAEALGISARTVNREWVRAHAWLRADLAGEGLDVDAR